MSLQCFTKAVNIVDTRTMGRSCQVGEASLAAALKDLHSLVHLAEVEGVLELAAGVLPDLGDLHHLLELVQVAGDEVEEGELVEGLGPLVTHLDHLMVALLESHLAQLFPDSFVVHGFGRLKGHIQIPTFQGQCKTGLFVFDKVERDFWVA